MDIDYYACTRYFDQSKKQGNTDDRKGDELQHGGHEHDGTEPCQDGEPSLGWTVYGVIGSDRVGSDRELQEHDTVRPSNERQKPVATMDVREHGYSGRKAVTGVSKEMAARLGLPCAGER